MPLLVQQRGMNDLLLALAMTVLASTTGLVAAAILPPMNWWNDPRLFAPLLSAAVNGLWLLFRVWKRRRAESHRAQWVLKEADYLLRIASLEQRLAEHAALVGLVQQQAKDLHTQLSAPVDNPEQPS